MMQDKINILTDLLKSLKSERQRNYAIKLLGEIIAVINNQSAEVIELTERKFNILPGDGEHELDKYITLLKIFGFSQVLISLLSNEFLDFMLIHRNQLTSNPTQNNIQRIQWFYNQFEFENDRKPEDLDELKKYIIEATS